MSHEFARDAAHLLGRVRCTLGRDALNYVALALDCHSQRIVKDELCLRMVRDALSQDESLLLEFDVLMHPSQDLLECCQQGDLCDL